MKVPAMTSLEHPQLPWWRVGTAWFGVLALGTVVIASFMLLFTALDQRDTVVDDTVAVPSGLPTRADSPAQQARNHAATPRQAGPNAP